MLGWLRQQHEEPEDIPMPWDKAKANQSYGEWKKAMIGH